MMPAAIPARTAANKIRRNIVFVPVLSVTGKADGVAGVVSGVVHEIAARETRAGQEQKQPKGEDDRGQ